MSGDTPAAGGSDNENEIPDTRSDADFSRWYSLLRILQHQSETIQELLDYALKEAISLTSSKIGYIYLYDEERREFILNSWSKEVMKECRIVNPETCYELDRTGIWGEAVRQDAPIVVNNFQSSNSLKKGYPEGHVTLKNYLTTPVHSGKKIVAVIGVANKETDYGDTDIIQLQLLMDAVWKIVEQKRATESERKLRISLQERIKELKCLADIGKEMHKNCTIEEFCIMVACHLKNAMYHPENSCPVIEVNGKEYQYGKHKFKESIILKAELSSGVKSLGRIKIYNSKENPFLVPEEQELLDQVATMASLWIIRKQMEEQVIQSEKGLHITLQSIGDGVIATDPAGRVVRMNPVAEKLTGCEFSKAREKNIEELFTLVNANTRRKVRNPVEHVLRSGSTVSLANHTVMVTPDGQELQVADSAAPIRDEKGTLHGVVFVFSDVTDKYKVMEDLRISEERYRHMAEITETILWEFDVVGNRWAYVAPQVKRILGYDPGEWTDLQFWTDNLHKDDREWARK